MKVETIDAQDGGDIMTIAVYNRQHDKYMREMEEYIDSFKKLDKAQAQAQAEIRAKESLIRSGVLNEDGTVKKQICG